MILSNMPKKRMNCRVAKIIREFLEGNKEEALAMIKKLKMADGVVFEGSCEMLKYTGSPEKRETRRSSAAEKKKEAFLVYKCDYLSFDLTRAKS